MFITFISLKARHLLGQIDGQLVILGIAIQLIGQKIIEYRCDEWWLRYSTDIPMDHALNYLF